MNHEPVDDRGETMRVGSAPMGVCRGESEGQGWEYEGPHGGWRQEAHGDQRHGVQRSPWEIGSAWRLVPS